MKIIARIKEKRKKRKKYKQFKEAVNKANERANIDGRKYYVIYAYGNYEVINRDFIKSFNRQLKKKGLKLTHKWVLENSLYSTTGGGINREIRGK